MSFFQFSMEKNKDKKKKKVVQSDSSSDSGPEDVSIQIVNKHSPPHLKTDVLMTGQSLQIQAVYVCTLPVMSPSLQYRYVFCWEYDVQCHISFLWVDV